MIIVVDPRLDALNVHALISSIENQIEKKSEISLQDIDGIPIPSPTKEQRMKEDKQQELIRRMHNSRRQNNQ